MEKDEKGSATPWPSLPPQPRGQDMLDDSTPEPEEMTAEEVAEGD